MESLHAPWRIEYILDPKRKEQLLAARAAETKKPKAKKKAAPKKKAAVKKKKTAAKKKSAAKKG